MIKKLANSVLKSTVTISLANMLLNTCVNCWKRTRMHTNVNSLAPSRTALLLIPLKICTSKPMPLSVRILQDLQGREGNHQKEVRCQEAYLCRTKGYGTED